MQIDIFSATAFIYYGFNTWTEQKKNRIQDHLCSLSAKQKEVK